MITILQNLNSQEIFSNKSSNFLEDEDLPVQASVEAYDEALCLAACETQQSEESLQRAQELITKQCAKFRTSSLSIVLAPLGQNDRHMTFFVMVLGAGLIFICLCLIPGCRQKNNHDHYYNKDAIMDDSNLY